ncbi:DNA-binding transcriptional regulator, LysR family [Granulicella rosea]|uniref:DNA-binding transcriptional regulator, LysR family n=1 Tax=Granulicella rosea TaxID=474952 RepID=A0A239K3H8_9BACT|nr:LysR family transcriptional regulator [Granulicella rosea]SNT12163.1 DNA-binding transcriptional regulator, LysR family [Granulicella rosea]
MDIARIRTFRVVAELLNYRKAAQQLHLTQPAVTAQIQSLEQGIGIALFNRVGRGVALTKAGEVLLSYARRMEILNNEAAAALSAIGSQEEFEIGLGASHTLAVYLLPRLLPSLLASWPKLRIHIHAGSTSEVLDAISTYRISLGIIEAPGLRPDLKIEPFGQDELSLIVPVQHRWTGRRTISAAELAEENLLLREPGAGMRRYIEDFFDKHGLRRQLRNSVAMNSTEGILAAVEAGAGVGFVSYLALEKALKLNSVRTVPIEGGPILRPLSIVLHEGPEPQGPVQQLIYLLRQYAVSRSQEFVARPTEGRRINAGVTQSIRHG